MGRDMGHDAFGMEGVAAPGRSYRTFDRSRLQRRAYYGASLGTLRRLPGGVSRRQLIAFAVAGEASIKNAGLGRYRVVASSRHDTINMTWRSGH